MSKDGALGAEVDEASEAVDMLEKDEREDEIRRRYVTNKEAAKVSAEAPKPVAAATKPKVTDMFDVSFYPHV